MLFNHPQPTLLSPQSRMETDFQQHLSREDPDTLELYGVSNN